MANYRLNRINEDIQRELSALLRTVKDPRVSSHMLSVLRVDTSSDLSYCKVYLSTLDQADAKDIRRGLKSATGYLRRELGHALGLRKTPELTFLLDNSIDEGARIIRMMEELEEQGK